MFFFFNLINILAVFIFFISLFFFYFIMILFNLLAKAVLQYDPNHKIENQKQPFLMGNGVQYCLSFFLSFFTSKPPRRTQTVYIIHSGLQDEDLQVTN